MLDQPARKPPDEQERMAELKDFSILDTAPDDDYERLVQLASVLCETPMAALTFIDHDRQWFKARVGLPPVQIPRRQALCAHTILDSGRLLEVEDVAGIPWFDASAYGHDGRAVRFYAAAPLKTRDGSAIGALCVMDYAPRTLTPAQRESLTKLGSAVASQLKLRRQLRVATQTDRLTGLPNWLHFESQFDTSKPSRGIVAFVRLRTVNQINSAHGFRVADNLIQQTADRLRAHADGGTFIGRIKRGLFIMFFPDMGPKDFSLEVAPRLTTELHTPYGVNDLMLVCPVNLGFATYPDDGKSLDEVVNAADAALQMAIERDESVAFFDKSVDNQLSVHYRLEPQLRKALRLDQFVNYYQPKINLATGEVSGVEALVRWIHPERGVIPPLDFVPALESTGLIREVGSHVIKRAMVDWAAWRAAGLKAPRIAVNVAAGQLRSAGFVEELRRAIESVGAQSSALGIEVTESVLISNIDTAIEALTQVRELGVPVAIDDFGTGYSSLAYIVTLPIDELKIDRAFIKKITADPAYRGIVHTCISLAHNLSLKVVAEGVETLAQQAALQELGCDEAQGYYYSPPIPADQMAALLLNRRSQ
ncbi:MAG: sensor domain-containing phosphodiesterase [Bdellovibrionales bacterium]|nr:sensor domain-containing phosphodiesterase [Ramlibacter sp.]